MVGVLPVALASTDLLQHAPFLGACDDAVGLGVALIVVREALSALPYEFTLDGLQRSPDTAATKTRLPDSCMAASMAWPVPPR